MPLEPNPVLNVAGAVLLGVALFAIQMSALRAVHWGWGLLSDEHREKVSAVLEFSFGKKVAPEDALALLVFANLIIGAELPTMGILLVMMVILLFMGAFMDWVGIVLLIIPVFLPIVQRLPIEEIGLLGELQPKYVAVWFGVLFCMNMQVSFLSPPFGPAAFYLKSVAPPHISLTDIFKGFLPFICIQILALSVLLIWPPIVEILLK